MVSMVFSNKYIIQIVNVICIFRLLKVADLPDMCPHHTSGWENRGNGSFQQLELSSYGNFH